jgi:hypothetical protein
MRPGRPTGKVTSNVSSRGSGGKLRETHASISTAKVAKPTHQRSARREGRAGVGGGGFQFLDERSHAVGVFGHGLGES